MNLRMPAVFAALFFALLASGQQPAGTPQPPLTLRSTSRLVTIDVVVTDGGHPVKGLSKDAFRVLENGKEQEVRSFEEHSFAGEPAVRPATAALPAHTYSNAAVAYGPPSVLLLDALNTPVHDQQYLRKQMIAYLKELSPGTRIAIFTLGTRLRMVQGFTTDIAQLVAAMESRKSGPTPSVLLDTASDQTTPMDSAGSTADNPSTENSLDVLDQFQAEIATVRTDIQVQTTLDAMKQLAAFLGALPGRKTVIWLSGSFPLSLEPDESANNPFITQRTYSAQLQQISDEFTAGRIAVYPVDVRGVLTQTMFDAEGSSSSSGGRATRRAGRSGPGGFGRDLSQFISQTAAEHASMQQLAEETGGHAFYESNALKQAVMQAMDDGASYYTLTYSPQNKDFNGKFRKIAVKLAQGNYHLAYRRGYYADSSDLHDIHDPRILIDPRSPALQRGAPPATQLLFRARVLAASDPLLKNAHLQQGPAGMVAQKGPVIRYCVDYMLDMREVNANSGGDHLYHSGLEVLAVAYDADGKALNIVDQPFQLSLKQEDYDRLLRDGLPLHEEIDVPKGEAWLRVAVHDLMTDHVGSFEVPLAVPSPQPKP